MLKFSVMVVDQLAMHFMQAMSGVHLHVLTCVHVFHISGSSGRIILKYGVMLEPLAMRFAQAMSRAVSACAQVQVNFQAHLFASARSSLKRRPYSSYSYNYYIWFRACYGILCSLDHKMAFLTRKHNYVK